MRIFLSYGHDDYASLAVRIKRDLEELGHAVWFDVEHLKPGGDWERYIAEGFEFASKEVESGLFLLLMTPHSVRRPNGYCLNELARAYSRNLPIIPVMVSTVEPPLSIARLQWLDMRECFPAEEHEDQYKQRFALLVVALTKKQVPFEGVQQRLLNYLQPITYADDLARHLSRFTGREWLKAEVEGWLASTKRVLWVTGEAGVGKSAVAAWLCDKRPEIVAYHFCRFRNTDRVDARRALFSLAYQLSTQFPVYQERLNASPLDKTALELNVPAVFDRLFVSLLTDDVPLSDKPRVMLIDALDEATRNGRNELASLIGHDLDRLPSWLRVIITSRPHEQEINSELQVLDPWTLDAGCDENLKDIRTYLYRELQPFTGKGAPAHEVVDQIINKSEGLFLYVTLVREELEKGRLSLARLEEFPQGLGGVYLQWFQRYFPDIATYQSDCRPALEVICAAREPLPRNYLEDVMGWPHYKMDSLAERLGSLFPFVGEDERVRPFHQSLRDWLTDRKRSYDFRVDLHAGEQRLSDFVLQQYRSGVGSMSHYSVLHAPSHFAASQRKSDLKELLLNPDWVQAKLRALGVVPLLKDYGLALDTLSLETDSMEFYTERSKQGSGAAGDSTIRLLGDALRKSAHVLARDPSQLREQLFGRLRRGITPELDDLFEQIRCDPARHKLRARFSSLDPIGSPLLQTLSGHTDDINVVLLLRDGAWALSWSEDRTLRLWDLQLGRQIGGPLSGHTDDINGVLLLRDGMQALSWSEDRTLRLWDLQLGRQIGEPLSGHTDDINGVLLLRDGTRALSWSEDRTLRLWDLQLGRQVGEPLSGHKGGVTQAVLLDGRRALSWGDDETVRWWNLETGKETGKEIGTSLASHRVLGTKSLDTGHILAWGRGTSSVIVWDLEMGNQIGELLFDNEVVATGTLLLPDGERALSWGTDCKIRRWELETGKQVGQPLIGHQGLVGGALPLPDGKQVLSWSTDGTLRRWNLQTGKQLGEPFVGHEATINDVLLMPDGKEALSWTWDDIRLWDLERGKQVGGSLVSNEDSLKGVILLSGEKRVLSWQGQTLKLWDLEATSGTGPIAIRESEVVYVERALLLRDGKRVLSWSSDNTLLLWDLAICKQVGKLVGHEDRVRGALLLPNGARAVSWGNDGTLRRWDFRTCKQVGKSLTGHERDIYGALLLPGEERVLSWGEDGTLRIWDLETGKQVGKSLSGHKHEVRGALLLPGGKRALSWSHDLTLRVWDLRTKKQIGEPLIGHEDNRDDKDFVDEINGVLVLPSGTRALSWSQDRTLRLWDLKTHKQIGKPFIGHEDDVTGAQLLSDEKRVLSWSNDQTLRIWDLETGKQVGEPVIRREEDISGAQLLSEKNRVLSWGNDGTLRIWDLETGKQIGKAFIGHEGEISGVKLLAGGNKALSWGEDGTLRLWDLATSMEVDCSYLDGSVETLVDCRTKGFFVATHGGRVHFLELLKS